MLGDVAGDDYEVRYGMAVLTGDAIGQAACEPGRVSVLGRREVLSGIFCLMPRAESQIGQVQDGEHGIRADPALFWHPATGVQDQVDAEDVGIRAAAFDAGCLQDPDDLLRRRLPDRRAAEARPDPEDPPQFLIDLEAALVYPAHEPAGNVAAERALRSRTPHLHRAARVDVGQRQDCHAGRQVLVDSQDRDIMKIEAAAVRQPGNDPGPPPDMIVKAAAAEREFQPHGHGTGR